MKTPAGTRRFAVALAIAAVLPVAMAGCGPQAAAPQWSAAGSPSPKPAAAAPDLVGVYKELIQLKSQVAVQREKMIAKCMAGKGFHVHPNPTAVPAADTSPIPDAHQWQLDAGAVAQDGYGYGTTLTNPAPTETTAPKSAYDKLPKSERTRYETARDAQPKGCAALVRQALVGPSPAPGGFGAPSPNDLLTVPAEQAASDKRVTGMFKTWTACMARAGYAGLHDPDEAYKMVMRRYGAHGTTPVFTAARQQAEIKQAKADLACRTKAKMASVMVTVMTEKATALLRKDQQWLMAWRDDARGQLERADAYLAG
jgi:hypothetical protein